MQAADSQVNALITLLGDDDEMVRRVARQRLLQYGDGIFPLLRKIARTDSEGLLRIEAQIILEEGRLEQLTEHFRQLNRSDELDLEQASFVLAQIEYPDLDVNHYVRLLDEMAEEVAPHISPAQNVRRRIEALSKYMFQEKGFRGNSDAYYDPQNSYINRVLDRQLGIPISLSSIYLFIAKRLELPVHGVGFPGHFLLKYSQDADLIFIDAFNHGQILTRDDCLVFLQRMGYRFYDFYLYSATHRDILSRMIRNLVLIYIETNQPKKIEVLERIFSDFIMA